jgi:hypothetical protein
MKYNAFLDAKFWTLLVDSIVSALLFFFGKYSSPDVFDNVKFLIAAIQPIVVLILAGLFQAEAIALRAGIAVRHFVEK